jgi:peptidylprolyl isomerase
MALHKGDFILIDHIAKVKETGEIFDTTIEETAKKEHLYKEGEIYEPKLIVIGEGWVLKTLDESLTTIEITKKTPIEIPPKKAFGERNPEKIKRVSLRNLTTKGITPSLGKRIEYNGKMATIRTIGAGRVLLDFNPPLAGKTLIYEVTIQKKLTTKKQKIAALIHRRIPAVEKNKIKFTTKQTAIDIEMPEDAFYIEGIQVAKRGIAIDIQKFFPKTTTIKFVETFKTKPKTQTTPPTTNQPTTPK